MSPDKNQQSPPTEQSGEYDFRIQSAILTYDILYGERPLREIVGWLIDGAVIIEG